MKELFTELVKETGITILLTAEKVSGILDVYCYEWVGTDGKFYSIVAACNDTEVFTDANISLANDSCSALERLKACVQVYETKEEWSSCSAKRKKIEEFQQYLKGRLENIRVQMASVGDYSAGDCRFYVKPAFGVSFKVWKCGRIFDSIAVWKNAVTNLSYRPEGDLVSLFNTMGLSTKITWEGALKHDIGRIDTKQGLS